MVSSSILSRRFKNIEKSNRWFLPEQGRKGLESWDRKLDRFRATTIAIGPMHTHTWFEFTPKRISIWENSFLFLKRGKIVQQTSRKLKRLQYKQGKNETEDYTTSFNKRLLSFQNKSWKVISNHTTITWVVRFFKTVCIIIRLSKDSSWIS